MIKLRSLCTCFFFIANMCIKWILSALASLVCLPVLFYIARNKHKTRKEMYNSRFFQPCKLDYSYTSDLICSQNLTGNIVISVGDFRVQITVGAEVVIGVNAPYKNSPLREFADNELASEWENTQHPSIIFPAIIARLMYST